MTYYSFQIRVILIKTSQIKKYIFKATKILCLSNSYWEAEWYIPVLHSNIQKEYTGVFYQEGTTWRRTPQHNKNSHTNISNSLFAVLIKASHKLLLFRVSPIWQVICERRKSFLIMKRWEKRGEAFIWFC